MMCTGVVCVYVHMCACVCMHVCTGVCVCMCVYVWVCMCVWLCNLRLNDSFGSRHRCKYSNQHLTVNNTQVNQFPWEVNQFPWEHNGQASTKGIQLSAGFKNSEPVQIVPFHSVEATHLLLPLPTSTLPHTHHSLQSHLVGFSKHHDVTPIHIDSIEEPGQ